MRIIHNDSLNPYFNLAAEEYLIDNEDGDVFMLWRNSPAVIIGRNQNAWAEVDTDFTRERGIAVVRRLTGGGAVFHDPGNVNFTFITDADSGEGINFSRFTAPIISALEGLGIQSMPDGRNDIVSGGFKISGNAQCVRRRPDGKNRLLHHGTLLYDADLASLAGALRVNRAKLKSKGIRSVSSRVKNLREIGKLELDSAEFLEYLKSFAEREYGVAAEGITEAEEQLIKTLAESKYSLWEWNFGESPEYENSRCGRFPWGTAEIGYTLESGVITAVTVRGDFFGTQDVSVLEKALLGSRYKRDEAAEALAEINVGDVISGASAEDVISLLFQADE